MIKGSCIQLGTILSSTILKTKASNTSQVTKFLIPNFPLLRKSFNITHISFLIFFLIGVEGSEGITSLAVSQAKKYLAVCEKGERALCSVYDL
jgi:hypothetical protein